MKQKHVLDELSAYIDGEARHPERIERHLRQCPECARRHMALLKLSSHLSAMEGPEVAPAFLTRVMAHARETEMLSARRFAWSRPLQAGSALALFVVVLALFNGIWPNARQPVTAPPAEQVATGTGATYLDEDTIIEAMAELMDEGVDLAYVASDMPRNWLLDDSNLSYDDVVALLADQISEDESELYPSSGVNVYGMIDGMETSEAATLESLLTDYLGKG